MSTSIERSLQLLLVGDDAQLPASTREYLAAQGYQINASREYQNGLAMAESAAFDAMIIPAPTHRSDSEDELFEKLLRTVEVQGKAAIVLGKIADRDSSRGHSLIDYADPTVSKEEIRGRLSVLLKYHDVLEGFERDLDNMQRLFKQLNTQFTHVDQEMRLAGRLQNAFLPRGITSFNGVRFATIYRPASFVSGDIYDICRVDEDHIAFYIADAVGHGMAASLLTMFIKNAVVSKKVYEKQYEIFDPNETLQLLNQKLCDQELPNSQFVTACYCLLNTKTLELRFARAGHPYPMLVTSDGAISELKSPGGLLGLFEGEDFPSESVQLKPGQKIIIYSDGVELAFEKKEEREDELTYYREVLDDISYLPAEQMAREFSRQLDNEAGSLTPQDDVTLLILEVND